MKTETQTFFQSAANENSTAEFSQTEGLDGNDISNRYRCSEEMLSEAESCDAWAANRVTGYNSIEGAYPLYASHARGAHLWDIDGNAYIDYTLGYGTIVLGHADPRVNGAVFEEIKKGSCLSPLWKPAQVKLTKLLTEVIPDTEMAFLMKTGSDTTTGALRLARIFTGRDKVLRWGYNGWHDWATPRPRGVPVSIQNDTLKFDYNDLESLKAAFEKFPGQIACVLMMPFELEMPENNFLHEVKAVAHHYGSLFILDEMRSGFRLALGGAQEFFKIKADLATFSKSMSNGYTISAIVGRKEVLRGVSETKMTATYFASSAEMVAAIKTIEILRDTNSIEHIWAMGNLFQKGMREIINKCGIAAEVIGYPPYPFLKFKLDDKRNELAQNLFYTEAARLGVLFHPNHHWYISAAHTEKDILETLETCRRSFKAVSQGIDGK